ncbi:MAG: hypothetical protein M1820_004880 [Bogoriella megaspora]|nr:MAG: hypothetical protein M1820_004880 [Bogoriella megaspora]
MGLPLQWYPPATGKPSTKYKFCWDGYRQGSDVERCYYNAVGFKFGNRHYRSRNRPMLTLRSSTYPTPLTDIDSKFQWAGSLDAGSTTLTGDTLRPVPIHISLPTVTPSVDPEDPAGLTYAVRSKYHFGIHGADKSWMFDHANGSLSNMFRLIYEQCSVFEPGSFLSPDNSQSGQAVFAGEVQPGLISNYVLATTTVYISASVTTAQSHIVPSESHKTTPKQSFTTFMDSSEGPTTSIVTTAQTSPQFSASKSRAVSKIGVNSKIGSAHRIASSGDSLDPNRLAQTSLKLSTNDVGISETRGNSQGHDLADLVLSFIASSPKISNTLWTTAVDNQFTSGIDTETESEKATGNQVPKTATIQLPSAGMLRITSSNPFRLTKGGSSTRKSATMTTQHFSSSGTEEPQERTSPASSKLGVAASVKSAIEAAITIGSSTVTANSDSVYVLGTQTLSPGGYAVTVSGETLSLASDASILVLDGTSESVYTSINNGGVGGYIWSGFHESGSTTFSQTEYPSTIGVNGVGNATGTAAQPAGFPGQAVSQYSSIFFAFAIAPSLVSIFSILF